MATYLLDVPATEVRPRLAVMCSPNLMTFQMSQLPEKGTTRSSRRTKVTLTRAEAEGLADRLDEWLAEGENDE